MVFILLDAAHSMNDNKNSLDVYEYELNNKVCNKIEEYLNKKCSCRIERLDGRNGNVEISIEEKVKIARSLNPTILLSIHHNNEEGFKGISVCTGSKTSSENDIDPGKVILEYMIEYMKDTFPEYENINIKISQYPLCNIEEFPSIQIRGGYMEDAKEFNYFNSEKGLDNYAISVANALIDYYDIKAISTVNNISDIDNYESLVSANYDIQEKEDGTKIALQKSNLGTVDVITSKAIYDSEYFVVRKQFSDPETEKIRTNSITRAIDVCDNNTGYSVFDNDGKLVHKSTKSKRITSFFKKKEICTPAFVTAPGGLSVKDIFSDEIITLSNGTMVYIVSEVVDKNCKIRFKIENNNYFAHVNTKFIKCKIS